MNVLIIGDSVSVTEESQCKGYFLGDTNYVRLIELKNHTVTNLSVSGQSNQKILLKTCIELSKSDKQYDLIIVQWTTLFRINFSGGKTIYDSTANFSLAGLSPKLYKYKSFHNTWRKNFIHPRIEILEWLSQIILLETFLKNKGLPFIFIKIKDNFLADLNKKDWFLSSNEYKSLVLQVDKHPDWEISEIYNEMVRLYESLNTDNWVNLSSPSWYDIKVDFADDLQHPGPLSHAKYYNILENHIRNIGLIF